MWSPHWSTSGHASYLLPDSSKMGGDGTIIDLVREEGEINSVFLLGFHFLVDPSENERPKVQQRSFTVW